jgi:hypothetical protein
MHARSNIWADWPIRGRCQTADPDPAVVARFTHDKGEQLTVADKLAELARARNARSLLMWPKVPGVSHLLVPATTAEFEEYATLTEKKVSSAVASAIAQCSGIPSLTSLTIVVASRTCS